MFGSRRLSLCNLRSNPRYWYLDIYWNEIENGFCSCSEPAAVIEKHSPIVLIKGPKLLRDFQTPEFILPEAPIAWPILMMLLGLYVIVTLFVTIAISNNGFDIAMTVLSVVLYVLTYIVIRRFRLSQYHQELVEREFRIAVKLEEQRDLWLKDNLYPQVGYKGAFIRIFVGSVFDSAPQTTKYIMNENQWSKMVIRAPDLQGLQTPVLKPKTDPKKARLQSQIPVLQPPVVRPANRAQAVNNPDEQLLMPVRPISGSMSNNQVQPIAVVSELSRNRITAALR
jgi:hypothetical protein